MTDTSKYTSELNAMYNTIFSLIEEELYQRLHPSSYQDRNYDGTSASIYGSNFDPNFNLFNKQSDDQLGGQLGDQLGGKLSDQSSEQFNGQNASNFIPGKFEVVRSSYYIPLDVAIKGTIERQRLFMKEQQI